MLVMRSSIVHRLLTPHPPNTTACAKRRRQLAQGRLPQAPPPRGAHCSLTASARRSSRPGQARAPSTIVLGIELVYTTLRYASRDGRRNPAHIRRAAQTPSSGSPNCATTCPKRTCHGGLPTEKMGKPTRPPSDHCWLRGARFASRARKWTRPGWWRKVTATQPHIVPSTRIE